MFVVSWCKRARKGRLGKCVWCYASFTKLDAARLSVGGWAKCVKCVSRVRLPTMPVLPYLSWQSSAIDVTCIPYPALRGKVEVVTKTNTLKYKNTRILALFDIG